MDLVTIYTDNHDTEATFKISRRTTEKLFTAKNRINFRLFDVDVVKDNATGKVSRRQPLILPIIC